MISNQTFLSELSQWNSFEINNINVKISKEHEKLKIGRFILSKTQTHKMIKAISSKFRSDTKLLNDFYQKILPCTKKLYQKKYKWKNVSYHIKTRQLILKTLTIKTQLENYNQPKNQTPLKSIQFQLYKETHETSFCYNKLMEKSIKCLYKHLVILIKESTNNDKLKLYPEMIQLLLKRSKKINRLYQTKQGCNVLHYALAINDESVIHKANHALKGNLKKWIDFGYRQPLRIAILHKKWSFAQKLIEAGANINWRDKTSLKTCLHECLIQDGPYTQDESQVKFCLKQKNIDINAKDIFDMTPLHYAAQIKNLNPFYTLRILKKIWRQKEDDQDIFGRTAFDISLSKTLNHDVQEIDQGSILKKIVAYLFLKKSKENPSLYDKIDNLQDLDLYKKKIQLVAPFMELPLSQGACNGFAFLYAYYERHGLEEEYFSSLEEISGWDEREESLERNVNKKIFSGSYDNLKHLFEQWINDLTWFQHSSSKICEKNRDQKNRMLQLDIVKKREEAEVISFFKNTFLNLNEEQLREFLWIFSYYPNLILDVGGSKHATTVIIKPNHKIKYYDSNIPLKTRLFTPNETAKIIRNTKYRLLQKNYDQMNISLFAYQLCTGKENEEETIIQPLKKVPGSFLINKSANGWTPMHFAVFFEDIELFKKELKTNPYAINQKDRHDKSPQDWLYTLQKHSLIQKFFKKQK